MHADWNCKRTVVRSVSFFPQARRVLWLVASPPVALLTRSRALETHEAFPSSEPRCPERHTHKNSAARANSGDDLSRRERQSYKKHVVEEVVIRGEDRLVIIVEQPVAAVLVLDRYRSDS